MTESLQRFDYRNSGYQRPNQAWVCGWLAKGRPCQIGPDGEGNCRATFECQPTSNNDRWQCNRSELAGGRCDQGPLPNGTCCRAIQRCRLDTVTTTGRSRRGMRNPQTREVLRATGRAERSGARLERRGASLRTSRVCGFRIPRRDCPVVVKKFGVQFMNKIWR